MSVYINHDTRFANGLAMPVYWKDRRIRSAFATHAMTPVFYRGEVEAAASAIGNARNPVAECRFGLL